ncbi:MAG: transcription-repair coupling factor [Alphaproteobacteria bacterium]|nr:transcription-repair coupling factor [Alphaproteobacteria bacterium]
MLDQYVKGARIDWVPFIKQTYQEDNLAFVVSDFKKADYLCSILKQTSKDHEVVCLDGFGSDIYESSVVDNQLFARRSAVLFKLAFGKTKLITVLSLDSLNYMVPHPDYFRDVKDIKIGDKFAVKAFIKKLIEFGYTRVDLVRNMGQFAVRGGIIDVFIPIYEHPVRIDFLGDEIDGLRYFCADSQLSLSNVECMVITKCSEVVYTDKTEFLFKKKYDLMNTRTKEFVENKTLFPGVEWHLRFFHEELAGLEQYFVSNTKFVFDFELEKNNKKFFELETENKASHHKYSDIFCNAFNDIKKKFRCIEINQFEQECNFCLHEKCYNLNIGGKLPIETSSNCSYLLTYDRSLNFIENIFKGSNINRVNNIFDVKPHCINVMHSELDSGFISDDLIVFSEKDMFGSKLAFRSKRNSNDIFVDYSSLSQGDYVVHEKYGIGIFDGLVNLNVNDVCHDFLSLKYLNDDKLYVPVEDISLVTRYGADDRDVTIDSLKSSAWSKRKVGVRKRLLVIANSLLKLAAKRQLNKVSPIDIPENYDEFCNGFRFIETEDQLSAIEDVLGDLRGDIAMDRLICGDVGFGKTEVAMRAAFVVASSFKQVVILAPTTILAYQHYHAFRKRFEKFAIKVCHLSRFVSAKDMKKNLAEIASGDAQVIIATHAVFSNKVKFSDLGLVIIDEEQHFGVKQKEKLKEFNDKVHFMSMSATPIPRTLQLAISGVRDLSLITTPPIDRLPVKVIVSEFVGESVKIAIENEIRRGGQVFFVTPRVEFLDRLFAFVSKLFPNLRVNHVHGKTENLENIIRDFCEHQIDVLISTNIIDSGVDVPNANTILIHRFDLFGLSQLYQLRGRVGRSNRQAYAYYLLDNEKTLSESSKKRLEVLSSLKGLGSGFRLASHDLDIRGAGNLLGEEQSGSIKEVGIELYQSMLQEAILMLKAGCDVSKLEKNDPKINLGVPIFIPDSYIEDSGVRLEVYRRIGAIDTEHAIDMMLFELNDRFGDVPVETRNLLNLVKIKLLCRLLNIEKLDVGATGFTFSFFENNCPDMQKLMSFLNSEFVKEKSGSAIVRADQKVLIKRKWSNISERTTDIINIIKYYNENIHN